jgi:eukaryotic-like serine/threonine-protein kinase
MGEVYRATDSVLGRTVAVKLLAERHSEDADVRARFTREALAAARLSAHPHVVTVYDVGEHRGRPFIVMEYLSRGSVLDRLHEGPVEPGLALTWLEQTAQALDAGHAQGVVHRDVKPANLLLDEDGNVHVSDFGIASTTGSDTLTLPGTVLGTAGYLSPEQARGEPATAASDRYALGVVAFELLTGRRPFESDTPVTEAFAHVNAEVPRATTVSPQLPRQVDAVLERALAKEPGKRPASAVELVDDLRKAFRSAEEPTVVRKPAAAAPVHARRRADRRSIAYGAAALGVLVAGLASAALIAAGDDEPRERTVTRVRTVVSTVSDTETTLTVTETPGETETPTDGRALNDQGFALMQEGEFDEALPLLENAVAALSGTGSLTEAYASYNLAFTRFALDRCDGVLDLLDRSESIQGERREIDRLRRDAERTCDSSGRGQGGDD